MHKLLFGGLFAAGLTLATAGCAEQQYEAAVEDHNEEVMETREEAGAAVADGVIDRDEAEELNEAGGDLQESAGEVAEQRGELIESKTD